MPFEIKCKVHCASLCSDNIHGEGSFLTYRYIVYGFFFQLYSYSTLDGEVFGQRRDQAELLDGTIITLSQEQLRKVLRYIPNAIIIDQRKSHTADTLEWQITNLNSI